MCEIVHPWSNQLRWRKITHCGLYAICSYNLFEYFREHSLHFQWNLKSIGMQKCVDCIVSTGVWHWAAVRETPHLGICQYYRYLLHLPAWGNTSTLWLEISVNRFVLHVYLIRSQVIYCFNLSAKRWGDGSYSPTTGPGATQNPLSWGRDEEVGLLFAVKPLFSQSWHNHVPSNNDNRASAMV